MTSEDCPKIVAAQPWIGYSDPGHWAKTEIPDYWLMLAESHLTPRLFGAMVRRMEALPVPAG